MALEEIILTFFLVRGGKPAPPITMTAGIPEDAARYIRSSVITRIDVEWTVPDLSRPDILKTVDTPHLIIPSGQAFREHIHIPDSGKKGNLEWRKNKP